MASIGLTNGLPSYSNGLVISTGGAQALSDERLETTM